METRMSGGPSWHSPLQCAAIVASGHSVPNIFSKEKCLISPNTTRNFLEFSFSISLFLSSRIKKTPCWRVYRTTKIASKSFQACKIPCTNMAIVVYVVVCLKKCILNGEKPLHTAHNSVSFLSFGAEVSGWSERRQAWDNTSCEKTTGGKLCSYFRAAELETRAEPSKCPFLIFLYSFLPVKEKPWM